MATNKKKTKTPNLPPGSAQPPTVSTQTSSKSQPASSSSKSQPSNKKLSQRDRKRRQNIYLAIGAVVAAVVVLIGIIFLTNQSQQQVSKPAQAATDFPAGYIARNAKGRAGRQSGGDGVLRLRMPLLQDFLADHGEATGRRVHQDRQGTLRVQALPIASAQSERDVCCVCGRVCCGPRQILGDEAVSLPGSSANKAPTPSLRPGSRRWLRPSV